MLEENVLATMAGTQGDENGNEHDEQTDMGDTSEKLNPGDQPERVHVHQTLDNQHSQDDQSEVPSFCCIIRVLELDHTLQNDSGYVNDASFERYPAKPSGPSYIESVSVVGLIRSCRLTLNPSNKSLVTLGRKMMGPMVLSTSNGLNRSHLRQRCRLRECADIDD